MRLFCRFLESLESICTVLPVALAYLNSSEESGRKGDLLRLAWTSSAFSCGHSTFDRMVASTDWYRICDESTIHRVGWDIAEDPSSYMWSSTLWTSECSHGRDLQSVDEERLSIGTAAFIRWSLGCSISEITDHSNTWSESALQIRSHLVHRYCRQISLSLYYSLSLSVRPTTRFSIDDTSIAVLSSRGEITDGRRGSFPSRHGTLFDGVSWP